jgi:hypothetical protein
MGNTLSNPLFASFYEGGLYRQNFQRVARKANNVAISSDTEEMH